jgi:uncharacterized repeat protein (TIGR01451 family)
VRRFDETAYVKLRSPQAGRLGVRARDVYARARLRAALVVCGLLAAAAAHAQTPISLYRSYAGNIQFTGTLGTFRTAPNSGPGANPCAIGASAAGTLSGVPAGATVVAAHLYWAASGVTPDSTVRLANGASFVDITADRTFTESYTIPGGSTLQYFSGHEDVTAFVTGNGTYTLSNLTISNGNPWCGVSAVVGGWSLVVVYSRAAEPLRVVNISDGFRAFRGALLNIVDANFVVPTSGTIDAFVSHVTWEGDVENSTSFNGQTENLRFQGSALTDGLNPLNNQFNSASNVTGSSTTYGVDFDRYNVSALVTPGLTSATTAYSSGGDLVLLTAEVFSVTNVAVADLSVAKSHTGNFTTGQSGTYTLTVANAGPSPASGTTTLTDALPSGLSFVSATGTGWSCGATGQVVTCTHPGPLAPGAALPAVTLTVSVASDAPASLTNTATVSNPTFDNVATNNSASDPTPIVQLPDPLVLKSVIVLNDPVNAASNPKAIPGANVRYTIAVTNEGSGSPDADSFVVADPIPAELELYVNGFGGPSPVQFVDGATTSALTLVFAGLASATDDIEFDDGSSTFTYSPAPDADGYDAAVRAIRIRPSGTFAGASLGAAPSFELRFQARVQ